MLFESFLRFLRKAPESKIRAEQYCSHKGRGRNNQLLAMTLRLFNGIASDPDCLRCEFVSFGEGLQTPPFGRPWVSR